MIRSLLLLSFVLPAVLIPSAPVSSEEAALERVQLHMGGGTNADAAFSKIKELDGMLSDYDPDSEISEISKMAGKKPVHVDPEVSQVLKQAVYVAKETGGVFEPTVGALTIGVYRFGRGSDKVPGDEEIERAKSLVNCNDLLVKGSEVYLDREGMMLDLGGIGKGYAVKKAVGVLK